MSPGPIHSAYANAPRRQHRSCRAPGTSPRTYHGSTRLPLGGFGGQRRGADSLDLCGFARLGTTGDGTCSTRVMKGSPFESERRLPVLKLARRTERIVRSATESKRVAMHTLL